MSHASSGEHKRSSAMEASPGPIYYPDLASFSYGPHGLGAEYSIRGSFRVPIEEKHTTQNERPGPKYSLPQSIGKQYESTKRSFNAGKISTAPRITVDYGPDRSPGPAAYERGAEGLQTLARQRGRVGKSGTGMGCAQRFFDNPSASKAIPGPGAYKLPKSVGGMHPSNKSMPVYSLSKSTRDFDYNTGASPGPIYKLKAAVGTQVSSAMRSSAQFGFGTGSRFPVAPEENRQHLEMIRRMKRSATRPGTSTSVARARAASRPGTSA